MKEAKRVIGTMEHAERQADEGAGLQSEAARLALPRLCRPSPLLLRCEKAWRGTTKPTSRPSETSGHCRGTKIRNLAAAIALDKVASRASSQRGHALATALVLLALRQLFRAKWHAATALESQQSRAAAWRMHS